MMAVDIKNLCDYSDKIRNVSHILTETLGTTTSYTFLEDTLRPYVKKNLKEFVLNHWNDEELVEIVKALKTQAELEVKEGWVGAVAIPEDGDGKDTKEAVISYALGQVDGNSIESLSRLIVKDGYSKGHLKGHVFPDVFPAFKKWTEEGKKIYMYSSGLEMSRECLISNSVDGDITKLISGCFESDEYPRTKCESFRDLCKKVGSPADQVAFLTHNAASASAAHKAGLVVIMLSREGNTYIGNCTRESFPVITSFEDISKQICGKRKKAPDAVESTEGKRAKLEISGADAEVAKPEKTDENDAKASSDAKPKEEETAVTDAGEVSTEGKAHSEEEEKMEVDDISEEKEGKKINVDEGAGIKILVIPPVDEVQKSVEKVGDEVNGASEGEKETVKAAKGDEKEEKKDEQEEKPEVAVEKVVCDEKVEEKSLESKEEDSVAKESEDKKSIEDEKTVEADRKDTKDTGASEVKEEVVKDGEEKVDKAPCAEEEKSKENGVSEAVTLENGESGDGAGKEGSEKKEVNGNGVARVNGAGGDGESREDVTEPIEKETEKIVAKKVEKDEDKVEPTTEAVTQSA
ncbi:enolase-phosphatase E1-like [Hetaerina americana]|uniref:enolase-phosphatase E1-like n=1 Tax=Hetaerina americana TaxID=62018 RepID=UPI003A7F1D0C